MKLSSGQISLLRYALSHEAIMIRSTAYDKTFWDSIPNASPNTFYSLVKKGLMRVEGRHFYFITEEGRAEICRKGYHGE